MFWPSREKIPVGAVEGCRCSDSYKTLLEEQVGWHTSLVRGNGFFSKRHTDSYGYILRRKIFANCEKNFAFCKKKSEEDEVYMTFIQVFWTEKFAGLIKMVVFTHLFVQHFMHIGRSNFWECCTVVASSVLTMIGLDLWSLLQSVLLLLPVSGLLNGIDMTVLLRWKKLQLRRLMI